MLVNVGGMVVPAALDNTEGPHVDPSTGGPTGPSSDWKTCGLWPTNSELKAWKSSMSFVLLGQNYPASINPSLLNNCPASAAGNTF